MSTATAPPPPALSKPVAYADVETYGDVVWKQFRRNRMAYISMWLLVPLIVSAVFAPVLASNVPYLFYSPDDGWTAPWIVSLFHPLETIDLFFNMTILALVPWLILVAIQNVRWARKRLKWRTRLTRAGLQLVVIAIVATAVVWPESMRPKNWIAAKSFSREQFQSKGKSFGYFPPIPFGPTEQSLPARFQRPFYRQPATEHRESNDGFVHILGTDDSGRDVLVRMLYGTRVSITIGLLAVSLYLSIGCLIGAIAGYFGGAVDQLIARLIEIVLLFPAFFLILTLVAMFGRSIYIMMGVIGLTGWPTIARLTRAEVLRQRNLDYVTAGRALGFSDARIILRHILPNSLSPALVAAPFGIANAIVTEAGLSLLGFGVQPPAPTWGNLLQLGSKNYEYWWLVLFPSLAVFFTVTVFNLIGSGIRDAVDPRLRSTR